MTPAFRPDIQALRALAVFLVVAFHVRPATIPGGYVGVDVFFVISGYLITGQLLREVASTGRVHLPTFYARRARRLLPAASLTMVAVGLASYIWMPRWTWAAIATDMAASTVYAENWALIRRAVDYNAQDAAPSPLKHFWSLAVEEQFYLGWPLLVAGVAASWRRSRMTGGGKLGLTSSPCSPLPRRAYAVPMAALCAVSLACAVYTARVNPTAGYFMTLTRLHELGLGGLLAVWATGGGGCGSNSNAECLPQQAGGTGVVAPGPAASTVSIPFLARSAGAAFGLAAIAGAAFLYWPGLPFPGVAALLPALGAATFILAGEGSGGGGGGGGGTPDAPPPHALAPALSHSWLQYTGDISYSLYLTHWPVVVMYPFMTGRALDGLLADGAMAVAVAVGLAHACKRGWEDRFRGAGGPAGREADMAGLPDEHCGGGVDNAGPAVSLPGMLPRLRRSPLAGAAFMTLLMAAGTLSASFALHRVAGLSPTIGDETASADKLLHYALQTLAKATPLNVSVVTKPLGCADFFGANASRPYPGAVAALRNCPTLNSLSMADALQAMDDGRDGRIKDKPYPNALEDVPETPSLPRGRIAIMGDSHAVAWVPAFNIVGRRLGFEILNLAKPSCPPTLTLVKNGRMPGSLPFTECQKWVSSAVDRILLEKPLAVVVTSFIGYLLPGGISNDTAIAAGVVQVAQRIVAAGIPVLHIKSTPAMRLHVPNCLARETRSGSPGSGNLTACSVPAENALAVGPADAAAAMYPLMQSMSFDDAFCVDGVCPPIIGNVVVYGDAHHLTTAFSHSLAPVLENRLLYVLPFFKNLPATVAP